MRAPRRQLERISAALLALAWVFAPALSLVHALEGKHQFCPEHQAFEEADEGQAEPDCGPDCVQSHLRSSDHDGSKSHQECAFSHLLRRDASVAGEQTLSVAPTSANQQPVALTSSDARPIAVLRVAPKSSPPIALV